MQGEYDCVVVVGRINKFDIYMMVECQMVGLIGPPPPGHQCEVCQVWPSLLWRPISGTNRPSRRQKCSVIIFLVRNSPDPGNRLRIQLLYFSVFLFISRKSEHLTELLEEPDIEDHINLVINIQRTKPTLSLKIWNYHFIETTRTMIQFFISFFCLCKLVESKKIFG